MIGTLNQDIGRRLRNFREDVGLTTVQMAEILDVTDSHYRKLERGVYELKTEKMFKLRQILGVDPLYLLTGETREKLSGEKVLTEKERAAEESKRRDLRVIQELFRYCRSVSSEETGGQEC